MKRTTYKNYIIDTDNLGRTYIYYTGSPLSEDSDHIVLGFVTLKEAKAEIDNIIMLNEQKEIADRYNIKQAMNEELKNKLQELIEEEYAAKGWTCYANATIATALWCDIHCYIGQLNENQYDQATDSYINQDEIDDFIDKCMNDCIQRNINLL